MSIENFFDIVQWSKRQGVKEVTLLGGEPSLHPSFAAMVHMASSQEIDVRVVTNGARSFRRQLANGTVPAAELARVAVSLDSLDPAVQDEFRGPGAWQDAMETIDLLRAYSVVFDINVTAVRPVLVIFDAFNTCHGTPGQVARIGVTREAGLVVVSWTGGKAGQANGRAGPSGRDRALGHERGAHRTRI